MLHTKWNIQEGKFKCEAEYELTSRDEHDGHERQDATTKWIMADEVKNYNEPRFVNDTKNIND